MAVEAAAVSVELVDVDVFVRQTMKQLNSSVTVEFPDVIRTAERRRIIGWW